MCNSQNIWMSVLLFLVDRVWYLNVLIGPPQDYITVFFTCSKEL